MCGICGVFSFDKEPVSREVVAAMTNTLRHRGPDDLGVEVLGPVGLGQTRLSIIDLSDAGHQPMFSDDRNIALVFNGEIYNFPDLKSQLQGIGVSFRGRSDTEVILKAYQHWGADAFAKFNGMFAIAIWNKKNQTLCLVRDRFGIKPLNYSVCKNTFVFGSEIKAILAAGKIDRRIDWVSLHEYLYHGFTIAPRTMFEGIRRLQPGHFMTVTREGIKKEEAYWTLADPKPVEDDLETATDRVRNLLDQAIQRHLISDVPVGVFLSGGIDSGSITALASKHYGNKLRTFSVGFDFDRGVSELPLARSVAKQFGTDHHELHVEGKSVSNTIETLVRCHDEPFGDAANIPLFLLCEKIKGDVKVVLQGDGGDEIFAGYPWRYSLVEHPVLWRMVSMLASPLNQLMPRDERWYRMRRLIRIAGEPIAARRMALMLARNVSMEEPPTGILSSDALSKVKDSDPFEHYYELAKLLGHLNPAEQLLRNDCAISLPDQYLEKVDKSTMAHGIEVRVPFLDTELTRYAMGLPMKWKCQRGEKKWILRRAMRGIVPDRVLDGKKSGFGVPESYWLKEPLADYMRSVLTDPTTVEWNVFDERTLAKYMDEHTSGIRNRGILLYRLLNLSLWHNFYLS